MGPACYYQPSQGLSTDQILQELLFQNLAKTLTLWRGQRLIFLSSAPLPNIRIAARTASGESHQTMMTAVLLT